MHTPFEIQPEASPKDRFFYRIRTRVEELLALDLLPKKYAEKFLERVRMIEGPFEGAEDADSKADAFIHHTVEGISKYYEQLKATETAFTNLLAQNDLYKGMLEKGHLTEKKRNQIKTLLEDIRKEVEQTITRIHSLFDLLDSDDLYDLLQNVNDSITPPSEEHS